MSAPKEAVETGGAGRVVVTVQGMDRVGIVADVTRVLADARANLVDIDQSVLGDLFVMVAVADMAPDGPTFAALREQLEALSARIGLQILVQREEIFRAMHRV